MIALVVCLSLFVVLSVLAARQAIAFDEQRREEEARMSEIEEYAERQSVVLGLREAE